VVLAPMAGVTNVAYRSLCRRHGHGLFVSEMVGARALVEGDHRTALKAAFSPDEDVRSIQLYGVDPDDVEQAVGLLVDEDRVEHIDLNFGCPAPKVTRHGGGAALPWHNGLFEDIVTAAVGAAGAVPVTVKTRLGIDDDHLTYLRTALTAQRVGVAAIGLHARTAAQRYSGHADWDRIADLVRAVDIPVLGNGDIWEAADALRMMEVTGCAGVIVGRGCLGRPWLFRDLQAAFEGRPVPPGPTLGEVADLMSEHARGLADLFGQDIGLRQFRKHPGWYLQGFAVGRSLRRELAQVETLAELAALLERVDHDELFNDEVRRQPRGHTTGTKRVPLPHGWLEAADDRRPVVAAAAVSGG